MPGWELLINYSEMTNIKMDFYFIPNEENFLFKNVTSDKWVYLHEKYENMRLKFSEKYAKVYKDVIKYIDLKNKEKLSKLFLSHN